MNNSIAPSSFGPLEMLVIQATPYCNLDCKYCYLPTREMRDRISTETLELIFKRVFEGTLARESFMVLWHAGEPFSVPPAFYEKALAILDRHNTSGTKVRHSFQTNATLVTPEWCSFIKKHSASLGVSIDGPEFLHNRNRVTRSGRGTHDRVLKGIHHLQKAGIDFGVISVLTMESLDYPDEMYDFYVQNGIRSVGFNVEEVEGLHLQSSMVGENVQRRVAEFTRRFYKLAYEGDRPLRVREFNRVAPLLAGINDENFSRPGRRIPNAEVKPFMFVNVDHEGRFGTYSPELLGLKSSTYGDFYLGNVRENSFESVLDTEKFKNISRAIASGVAKCAEGCRYFSYCGGGAPVNKYFENGSFDSMESMHCRLSRQTTIDAVYEHLCEFKPSESPLETGPQSKIGRPIKFSAEAAAATELRHFTLPEHLHRRWWEQVAPEMTSAFTTGSEYADFVSEVLEFAEFKELALLPTSVFTVAIEDGANLRSGTAANLPQDLRFIVNLGDQPIRFSLNEAAVKSMDSESVLELQPREGATLPAHLQVNYVTNQQIEMATLLFAHLPEASRTLQLPTQEPVLSPGIRIYSSLGSHENAQTRVRLSAGTENNSVVGDAKYLERATLPKGPWRVPNEREAEEMWTTDLTTSANSTIAILQIPPEIYQTFRDLKTHEMKSSEEYLRLRKTPDFKAAVLRFLDYLEGFRQNETPFEIAAVFSPVGLPAVTFDHTKGKYVGIHFDDWDQLTLNERSLGQNRILLNLGGEDREFMIVNLPVHRLVEAVRNAGGEIGNHHAEWRDLVQKFCQLYPNYPVTKLRIAPGEAYIAPTENLIHDGTTLNRQLPDVNLQVRGYLWPKKALSVG